MQTITALVFCALLSLAAAVGWIGGSRHDRRLVAAFVTAAVATLAASALLPPADAYWAVLAVDCSLAAFAIPCAMVSKSYWPLWFAAFSLAGALTAIAHAVAGAEYWMFRSLTGFWALPALLSTLLGRAIDARAARQQRLV